MSVIISFLRSYAGIEIVFSKEEVFCSFLRCVFSRQFSETRNCESSFL
jgi:hypothetical protein